MLKWKPSTLNSVDFKLKIQTQQGVGIVPKLQGLLYVGQFDQPFAEIKVRSFTTCTTMLYKGQ